MRSPAYQIFRGYRILPWLVLTNHVLNLVEDHVVAIQVGGSPDSCMVAFRLGEISWIACASPDYLAQRGEPASLRPGGS